VSNIDPGDVLREARQLVNSHQYAEALEKYIWFHEHALDADLSFGGVRLSYAISEWVDLGELFPPAMRALKSVRDSKTETLMNGALDASLFHDVESINGALGQIELTRDLFKSIAARDRGLASKCFRVALESLVYTKEFHLARSFMLDPRSEINRFAIFFKLAPPDTGSVSREMDQQATVSIYVKNVSLILQVLAGSGEEAEANQIRQYALECVPGDKLRDMVIQRLSASPPSIGIQ